MPNSSASQNPNTGMNVNGGPYHSMPHQLAAQRAASLEKLADPLSSLGIPQAPQAPMGWGTSTLMSQGMTQQGATGRPGQDPFAAMGKAKLPPVPPQTTGRVSTVRSPYSEPHRHAMPQKGQYIRCSCYHESYRQCNISPHSSDPRDCPLLTF